MPGPLQGVTGARHQEHKPPTPVLLALAGHSFPGAVCQGLLLGWQGHQGSRGEAMIPSC